MKFFPEPAGSVGSVAWTDVTGKPAPVTALAGTNTGDQTTIVGITGTKAEFNTAATDGNFYFIGDPFVIENRTSDPGSPATGEIWIRTDL